DRQARIDALNVSRSFIIQAPAGSGKTELLIQRYLALLSIVEHPEEIIAITFTRKAAAEMQLRVLQALRRCRAKDKPTEPHELKTYELAGLALDKSAVLQWNLIGNPRRMRIQTLDALNASIARAQPLSSPNSGSRIVVGAELKAIHKSAALATLDWLAEKGDFQAATVNVLNHVDNNTWLYASYMAQMLGTRDQWLPFVGTGLLSDQDSACIREQFESSLEFAVTDHLQRALSHLSANLYAGLSELLSFAGSSMLDSDNSVSAIRNLANLSELPAPEPQSIQSWQGIAELLLTQKGLFRKKVDKRQGFPADNKAKKESMHSLLELMASDDQLAKLLHGTLFLPPIRYTDEQWQILLALLRLLPLAVTELKRLFNEQGISDHIDTAMTAGAALGDAENPGDIALLLDHQVKHLLVDEMQDTSSAQYRMLETLTAGWEARDGRTLYCVGDPMQSIYRFRNAEVGQFLLAKEHGLGGIQLQPLLLRQNFRSGANLVDWFNSVFPNVLAPNDDPLRGAVSYAEAVPADHLTGQGVCFTHAVFGADNAIEAVSGCRVIAETLDENPDDDMAVLVRGRTQLPQLLAELRTAGISYRAIEIDRLTDLPEIIDVLSLTRAAVHQGDRIAWLGLLRAPWVGLHWEDLHSLVRNDKDRTVWELLQDEKRLESLSTEGRVAVERSKIHLRLLVSPR
ncbi:MAG: UvrD-helicase domain-containing protein, partial [Woeseiaceae bacterium]|nr:UvrD-helicase domain-containing protein [Woeseiaceae bacterium]